MRQITWFSEPYHKLLQGKYDQVAEFYENLIEQEPEIVEHYWHLGLAYLLQGEEEQAQLAWFVVLSQYTEEKLEQKTQSLIKILNDEAKRQEISKNYELAWLVRGHIKEIKPDNYNNLIQLICLDSLINNLDINQFQSWNLPTLCKSIPTDCIDHEILINALSLIPGIPCSDSLSFVRYGFQSCSDRQKISTTIFATLDHLIYKLEYLGYVTDLIKLCLEFDSYNLSLINALFVFYGEFKEIDKSIEFAHIFLERSQSLPEKIFGTYQLLYTLLKRSNWQEGWPIAEQHIEYLKEFINDKHNLVQPFIKNSFVVVNQPLLYLQDTPKQSRPLFNHVSQVFQANFLTNTDIRISPFTNKLTNNRPLRIGYIGHTLNAHPVGYLSRWLIHYHDREKINSYAYILLGKSDTITVEYFAKKMDACYVFERSIQALIQKIQEDQIDILIDLDSWTLDLTCQVMALKPAPIQATWLGFDASGIPTIDYFIADPYVLPQDAEDYYSEKIWRLPHCYLGIDGFEMGVPTLKREDLDVPENAIVFMNFQNALKRHPHIIHQQMKILKAVPNSYLFVKGTGQPEIIQQLFQEIAQEEGVELDCLRFLSVCATEREHRANLGIADVVLDTYPYNGATTTLEVLWAGIPLVTRVGEQFAARNSYTFMMNAGISEGIAWTDEEYVDWGIKLGTDKNLRQQISWKLRQSRKNSPLWNGKQFASEMEKAYQQMWEIYLQSKQ